jgi:hypothetical protein
MGNKPGLGIEVSEEKLEAMKAVDFGRKPGFPFPRREGAGLWIKDIEPGEVRWK